MDFKKLSEDYKKACREDTKNELNDMLNNFVDDDILDKDYQEKIVNMIVG